MIALENKINMVFNSWTVICLFLLTQIVPLRAYGSRDFWNGSTSIAESKKCRAFICPIRVTPDHFTWEGHNISIHECWLERTHSADSNGEVVKFTMAIDGSQLQKFDFEQELSRGAVLRSKTLKFVEQGPEPHVLAAVRQPAANADVVCDSGFYYVPVKQKIKHFLLPPIFLAHPLTYTTQIRVFAFLIKAGQKTPHQFSLRLGTCALSPEPTKYDFGDTVLTFSLSPPDDSQSSRSVIQEPLKETESYCSADSD